MAGKPKFVITDGVIEVQDLEIGKPVNRPDVAATALGAFTDAARAAGGDIVGPTRLRLVPNPAAE